MNKLVSQMVAALSLVIGSGLILIPCDARADQCAWLDAAEQKYVVNSAVKLLRSSGEFVKYCGPCNDAAPGRVTRVDSARQTTPSMASTPENQFREVTINEESVDLAYVYVRTGSRVFTNAALLVGCPASGVAPVLYTAPGKSPKPVSWDDVARGDRRPQSTSAPQKK